MKYMLTIAGPEIDWSDITPEQMRESMGRWDAYTAELRAAGAMVAGEGLQPSSTATTIRFAGDEPITVDGPFAETKEQIGGFYLIDVEDLDAALEWARKQPVREGGMVEVRPVMDYEAAGGSSEHTSEEVAS
ncbi:MAG TPA: YciI family protein [Solirubrobacterales bacterium]|nr:YciI family protein [Solirubrobacterales bacterium]